MAENKPFKRNWKNYLIDKDFQLAFLLRFFLFTFIFLTIGGVLQYFISTHSILKEMERISLESQERKKIVTQFLSTVNSYEKVSVSPQFRVVLKKAFAGYNMFLQGEMRFLNEQIERTQYFLHQNQLDQRSAYWKTLLTVGLLLNILVSFFYGIFLTHRLAGHNYRMKKFAKQLRDKDFASPLRVRNKDFFKGTADEFEQFRIDMQNEFKHWIDLPEQTLKEQIKKYKF